MWSLDSRPCVTQPIETKTGTYVQYQGSVLLLLLDFVVHLGHGVVYRGFDFHRIYKNSDFR